MISEMKHTKARTRKACPRFFFDSAAALLLLILLSFSVKTLVADDVYTPWDWDNLKYTSPGQAPPPSADLLPEGNPVKVFLLGGIKFYQNNISRLRRGQRCPSWPSCSRFGYQSISKYGLWGFFMTIDRLYYRENNDQLYFYALTGSSDGFRFYDPPSNNYIFDKKKWRFKEK
jgi:hypothetical protein